MDLFCYPPGVEVPGKKKEVAKVPRKIRRNAKPMLSLSALASKSKINLTEVPEIHEKDEKQHKGEHRTYTYMTS